MSIHTWFFALRMWPPSIEFCSGPGPVRRVALARIHMGVTSTCIASAFGPHQLLRFPPVHFPPSSPHPHIRIFITLLVFVPCSYNPVLAGSSPARSPFLSFARAEVSVPGCRILRICVLGPARRFKLPKVFPGAPGALNSEVLPGLDSRIKAVFNAAAG